eukprot:369134-Alexandrium_andersonii.AAC.1
MGAICAYSRADPDSTNEAGRRARRRRFSGGWSGGAGPPVEDNSARAWSLGASEDFRRVPEVARGLQRLFRSRPGVFRWFGSLPGVFR